MAKKAVVKEVKESKPKPLNFFQQKDFYTLEYIEETWDLNVRFLRERIKDGSLVGKKVGVAYYVLHSDLLDYITKIKTKSTEV